MRYSKSLFCELLLKPELLDKIRTILSGDQTQFAEGVVLNEAVNASRNRSSQIRWIENPELRAVFDPIVADVNRVNDWNLELSHAEHFQHARYAAGGKYDWHVDQHPHPHKLDGLIRKVSFTLFLNDGYAGGELDLEVGSPRLENRCATFANKAPGTMVFSWPTSGTACARSAAAYARRWWAGISARRSSETSLRGARAARAPLAFFHYHGIHFLHRLP